MAAGSLDFGAHVGLLPPDELFDLVRRLETVGYESLWVGDHLSFHNPLYESLTVLTACAGITRRMRLGTAVYLLALRPPGLVAKVTATLDVLSGGRFVFGVGVGGENPREFALVGVPHRERGARVDEGIEAVRALWRDSPATFRGRFTSFEGVSIDPKPVQKPGPPIWIGGRSDPALRRAGRVGDGWVSYVVQPERYAQSLEKVRASAHAARRSLDGFTPSHLAFVTIGRDHERARATWVRLLSARYAQDFGPLAQKYGIVGTPEQCAEQLDRFREAGCRHVIVNAIAEAEDQREQLETFAAEVIPRFRAG